MRKEREEQRGEWGSSRRVIAKADAAFRPTEGKDALRGSESLPLRLWYVPTPLSDPSTHPQSINTHFFRVNRPLFPSS